MGSRVEKRRPRKQKPKPKISELDETAAKNRRTQTRLAQQAYRKRNKETIASLTARNTDLYKAIENLNSCFLTFTNDLVESGWLEQDPQLAKSLHKTIETFITVVQESHIQKDDNPASQDDQDSGSSTIEPVISAMVQGKTVLPKDEPHTIVDSATDPIAKMKDVYDNSRRSQNVTAPENQRLPVLESTQSTAKYEKLNGTMNFQSFSFEWVPTQFDAFNYMPQIPRPIRLLRPTFAQKLHVETIRTGLRLVCTAEDSSDLFYRVFNRVLDIRTRKLYRAHMNKMLDEDFHEPLQPPPESNLNILWSGGESQTWLNASDVASYFRSLGIDLDLSLEIAEVETTPTFWSNIWNEAQDVPTVGHITSYGDGLANAIRDPSEFGLCTEAPAYNARGFGSSVMSIDVSRLIHEIIQGARCYSQNPTFNRTDLNFALARAVVPTQ